MKYKSKRKADQLYNIHFPIPEFSDHCGGCCRMYIPRYESDVVYMCEECFELLFSRRLRESAVRITPYTNTSVYLEIFHKEIVFAKKCPFCEAEDVKMIELDYNISKAISLLNKKGFTTAYSCEGHLKYSDCFPYILFKGCDILQYTDFLGDSWFVDLKPLYGFPEQVAIRSNWVENENDKIEYLIELFEWVKSLPSIK